MRMFDFLFGVALGNDKTRSAILQGIKRLADSLGKAIDKQLEKGKKDDSGRD